MITTSTELEELIDSTVNIPTIPTLLSEINRVVASEEGSAREAGELIERDPAIAAKVLRLVNSSFYGLQNKVTAIPLACSILGLKVIRNLVVQATVLDAFAGGPELDEFDVDWLWDHSFKTAMAARLLAKAVEADVLTPDDAYTCGLIHDVGKMILLQSTPERFAEALRCSKENRTPLGTTEGALFGFSHAHVGGLLAQRWKLADDLQAAVMYHHSPGGDPESWAKGFLISAANAIAHEVAEGSGGWIGSPMSADSMATLGLAEETLAEIRAQVAGTAM